MKSVQRERRYSGYVGARFGSLMLIGFSSSAGDGGRIIGVFACDCGRNKEWAVGRVVRGYRTHCGCQTDHGTHRTHGMRYSREYAAWVGMKNRCTNVRDKDYQRWGGRGVTVCREWLQSFDSFYQHLGNRPTGHSLDRIDNNKGYEPGNVRWATPREQASNRRDVWAVRIGGTEYGSVAEAARAHGVSETTVVRWCGGCADRTPRNGCSRARRYA